eukprot:2908632-Prymnesium_polylepis.1
MQDLAERADCVLRHLRQAPKASSQQGEDHLLLPTLLRMAAGAPGVFVELGALDGRMYSNTIILEKCFSWRGVLVEANPTNYQQLRRSGRTASLVHAAICDEVKQRHVQMTIDGGAMAGDIREFSARLN